MSKTIVILEHPRPIVEAHYNDVANAPLSASLNCGYAAAVINGTGNVAVYMDFLSRPKGASDMARQIIEKKPAMLLIHWVYNWDDGRLVTDIIQQLREYGYEGIIAAFGLFPTLSGHLLLKHVEELDLVFVGEFEATLVDTVKQLQRRKGRSEIPLIPGLLTRKGDGGPRKPIQDLTRLPVPLDLGKTSALTALNVAGSRGCYGNCTFCFIPGYYSQSGWRGRPVPHVMKEIDSRLERLADGKKSVYFVEPNFFGPGAEGQRRAIEMGQAMEQRGLTFGLEARVNDIVADTVEKLSSYGLKSVFLGIESASLPVLKRMRKGITPEQSARAIRILRDNGIFVSVGFIMFDPESTLDDLSRNVTFLEENRLLEHHDQTANMLHHNQIVLHGSPAYHLLTTTRLKPSTHSPFHFDVHYRNKPVAAVNEAMGALTLVYFKNMDRVWRNASFTELQQYERTHCATPVPIPENDINRLLVETFKDFMGAAATQDYEAIKRIAQERRETLDGYFQQKI